MTVEKSIEVAALMVPLARHRATRPRRCQRPPALLLRSAERTLRVPLARELCRSAPFFGQPAVGYLAPLDSGLRPPALLLRLAERTLRVPLVRERCRNGGR